MQPLPLYKVFPACQLYNDIEIIGYGDLDSDNFSLNKNVFVDNADDVLNCLINKFYSIKVIGYSATIDENETRN